MSPPEILVSPSLDDVQAAVSKAVVAILCTSKSVREWGREGRQGITFHSRVTMILIQVHQKDVTDELVHLCTAFRTIDFARNVKEQLRYTSTATVPHKGGPLVRYKEELERYVTNAVNIVRGTLMKLQRKFLLSALIVMDVYAKGVAEKLVKIGMFKFEKLKCSKLCTILVVIIVINIFIRSFLF